MSEILKEAEKMAEKLKQPRYCSGCKWARKDFILNFLSLGFWGYEFAKCVNSDVPFNKTGGDIYVEGKKGAYCTILRSFSSECGPEGKYWEPKK